MDVQIIELDQCAPAPWPNGAGTLRVLASHPEHADLASLSWRISVAAIGRDAPFSPLPGWDRCIVLLHGHGLTLSAPDSTFHQVLDTPGQMLRFEGETPLYARLIDGPMDNLSVLVRRGQHRCELLTLRGQASQDLTASGPCLVLCLDGVAELSAPAGADTVSLTTGQTALLRYGAPGIIRVISCTEDSWALVVRIVPLQAS